MSKIMMKKYICYCDVNCEKPNGSFYCARRNRLEGYPDLFIFESFFDSETTDLMDKRGWRETGCQNSKWIVVNSPFEYVMKKIIEEEDKKE